MTNIPHGWHEYTDGTTAVIAVQFWPSSVIWPECIQAWGINEPRLRDMSWGHVDSVPVNAGDYIVKCNGGYEVLHPAEFHHTYKAVAHEAT